MGRKPCCDKEGLNRGTWSVMEDQILANFIKVHGEGKWRDVPKRAGLNRCGKSCRLRWLNYLRPDIKRGNISPDEEDLIIRLHNLLGNRWSLIAGRLPGRTDNEIKNFWNTNLSKRIDQKICILNKPSDPNKTKTPIMSTAPQHTKISSMNTDKPADSSQYHPVIRAKPARCTKKVIVPQYTAVAAAAAKEKGSQSTSTSASASKAAQDDKNMERLCCYGLLEDFDIDELLIPEVGEGELKKQKNDEEGVNEEYYCDCENNVKDQLNVGVEGGVVDDSKGEGENWNMVGEFFQSAEYEDVDFSFLNLQTD